MVYEMQIEMEERHISWGITFSPALSLPMPQRDKKGRKPMYWLLVPSLPSVAPRVQAYCSHTSCWAVHLPGQKRS